MFAKSTSYELIDNVPRVRVLLSQIIDFKLFTNYSQNIDLNHFM